MEWTRLRPTAYGRGSELTQSAKSGRSQAAAFAHSSKDLHGRSVLSGYETAAAQRFHAEVELCLFRRQRGSCVIGGIAVSGIDDVLEHRRSRERGQKHSSDGAPAATRVEQAPSYQR